MWVSSAATASGSCGWSAPALAAMARRTRLSSLASVSVVAWIFSSRSSSGAAA